MAIRSKKNLYPGINPHLNSALQQPKGDWKDFHNAHLIHMRELLETILPDNYYVATEPSLQIGSEPFTYPDLLLAKRREAPSLPSIPTSSIHPTLTVPIIETLNDWLDEDEHRLRGLVIRSLSVEKPITRIELLSPTNKRRGADYDAYMENRRDTLLAGLRLIEIDYLHERRPILRRIPNYQENDPKASPYYVIISDPRPDVDTGETNIYGISILDKLPKLAIPLDKTDVVELDFSEVYDRTFSSARLYWDVLTDYSQLPTNFDSYTPQDQEKIRARMSQIAAEQT